jgi:hypothetical protein
VVHSAAEGKETLVGYSLKHVNIQWADVNLQGQEYRNAELVWLASRRKLRRDRRSVWRQSGEYETTAVVGLLIANGGTFCSNGGFYGSSFQSAAATRVYVATHVGTIPIGLPASIPSIVAKLLAELINLALSSCKYDCML